MTQQTLQYGWWGKGGRGDPPPKKKQQQPRLRSITIAWLKMKTQIIIIIFIYF